MLFLLGKIRIVIWKMLFLKSRYVHSVHNLKDHDPMGGHFWTSGLIFEWQALYIGRIHVDFDAKCIYCNILHFNQRNLFTNKMTHGPIWTVWVLYYIQNATLNMTCCLPTITKHFVSMYYKPILKAPTCQHTWTLILWIISYNIPTDIFVYFKVTDSHITPLYKMLQIK